jgi:hypothetical protein
VVTLRVPPPSVFGVPVVFVVPPSVFGVPTLLVVAREAGGLPEDFGVSDFLARLLSKLGDEVFLREDA